MDAEVQIAKRDSFARQSYAFLKSFHSERTRKGYRRDILSFVGFWEERGLTFQHPAELEIQHFTEYRDWLIERGYANATVCRKLIPIRSMMNFCRSVGIIHSNPLEVVKLPRPDPERPTPAYSDEQVRAILARPRRDKPSGRLHYAMLCVLAFLGVRRQELVNLKVKDLGKNKHHRTLTVRRGKGGKTRVVPLHPVVQTAIDEYLAQSGRGELGSDAPLFTAAKRWRTLEPERHLSPNTVYATVKYYVEKTEIGVAGMPHALRATVINHLLDGRAAIHDVAAMVGHSSVSTTTIYDRRRRALDQSAAYGVNYG